MAFCVILKMSLTMFIHNETPKSFAIFISICQSNFGIPVSEHIFSVHPFFFYFPLTFNYLRPGYIKTWLSKIRIKKCFPFLIGKNRMCYKFNDISILEIYPILYETWYKMKLKNQKLDIWSSQFVSRNQTQIERESNTVSVGKYFGKQIIIIFESYGHKNDFDIKHLYMRWKGIMKYYVVGTKLIYSSTFTFDFKSFFCDRRICYCVTGISKQKNF